MGVLCHEDLGRFSLAGGSYQLARQEFLRAIDIYRRTGNRRPWARAETFLGQAEYSLGNLGPAEAAYNKALRGFQDGRDYTNEAALRFGLGKLALKQHKFEAAGGYIKRPIDLTGGLCENASATQFRTS